MLFKFMLLAGLAVPLLAATTAVAATDTSVDLVQVTETSAGNYTFTESGFSGGATVAGTFSGTAPDGALQLSSFDDDLTAFSLSFSGNSVVPAFSAGLPQLYGLVYDLGSSTLGGDASGNSEGVWAVAVDGSAWVFGPGPLFYSQGCDGIEICGVVSTSGALTWSPSGTAATPEPASWGLMLAGFAGLGGCLRARRQGAPAALPT